MALKLRPYQENGKQEIYQAWDDHKNVMYVLPTGGGKSKVICSIAIDHAVQAKNKIVTAILVHRKELLQQFSLHLAEEKITHNIIAPRSTILQLIAAQRKLFNKQFYDYKSNVSIISVDTLNARSGRHQKWADTVGLWICDEAAHLLSKNKWGKAIAHFPDTAKGLGVTATPERLDKKGLGRHADGIFDTMIEGPGVAWLIQNDYLSKYKIAVPKSDYTHYLKETKGNSDFTAKVMEDAAHKSRIVGDVVDNYIKFANDKQTILFAPTITIAHEMEEKFLDRGIPAKTLSSYSSNQERLKGMIDFKEKEIKVLLNVDLFDEGLDVPGIECVIHARPTMSFSKYRQMCGRGLRLLPGKEYCIIIDHVGNVQRHGLPDKRHKWTLDRIKKKRKSISLIRVCLNPECAAPFERFLTECPYCGWEVQKSSGGGGGARTPPEQVDGDLVLIDPYTLNKIEKSTILEDPVKLGQRVARVAGKPAGIRAERNQMERINKQEELKETVAEWAGYKQHQGFSNREIHKMFYIEFGSTIGQVLSVPKSKMVSMIEELRSAINTERQGYDLPNVKSPLQSEFQIGEGE